MSRKRGSRARGFTLIELLVALTGGLFVSLAVFALARDANRFYQREGRMANATLAAVTGFERLRADLARAGFLASPNVQLDPLVCSRPALNAGPLLFNLASVQIGTGNNGSPANATLAANGISPHSLLLAGSYASADEFPVRSILANGAGSGYTIYLQIGSGAMARLGWGSAANVTAKTALLTSLFVKGRALRIVDTEGRQHYGLISGAALDPEGVPTVTLAAVPALELRQDQNKLCGLKGNETGATVNVVNFIKYDLRNLNNAANYPAYAPLYAESKSLNPTLQKYETDRTELVRRELDPSAANADTTLSISGAPQVELVAEYAVNFQLGLTTASIGTNPVLTYSETVEDLGSFAGLLSAGATPQRIRSVRARLGVRSREPDRDSNVTIGGDSYRIALASGGSGGFARIRTVQADVMLNNNANANTW
jgi:hypothetical protein